MTPQEKGLELFNKIAKIIDESHRDDLPKRTTKHKAKACAIIAVDEILDQSNKILLPRKYWEDVKNEIQKL